MTLRCEGLEVQLGSRPVVRGFELQAEAGEFVAIAGPSGCGKSTILRAAAGLIRPSAGRVDRGGGGVALVCQDQNLFPWMTAVDNAAFGLEMRGVPREERRRRAAEMLGRFGLTGSESAWPHQLSAGMKQRVAVARGFLTGPDLLLMDEPFSALDALTRVSLHRELLAVWEKQRCTVLFVTHDIEEAVLLSDRVLVLTGSPAGVAGEFQVPFARPRSVDVTFRPEFLELKKRAWSLLGADS